MFTGEAAGGVAGSKCVLAARRLTNSHLCGFSAVYELRAKPPPCGAPHGDRGNGFEFPVSVPLLDHEEFPTPRAPLGFDTWGREFLVV